MDKETREYIDKKFVEIEDRLSKKVPWINSPLLNGDVSIIGYSKSVWLIPEITAALANHEMRIRALEDA